MLLLIAIIIGCARVQSKPVADCSNAICHEVYITDDKSIPDALNEIVDCELKLDSQVECFKRALR